MALVTFGEGYHNYHHEFQYDYRNGVKPWQFDPTKWIIWSLAKLGMAAKLKRVPTEKIVLSELNEAQRRLASKLADPGLTAMAVLYVTNARQRLEAVAQNWTLRRAQQLEVTREMLVDLRKEIRAATSVLRLPAIRTGQTA
jgi:stearoyl-CoA desaturase (delta-9 desaturase)